MKSMYNFFRIIFFALFPQHVLLCLIEEWKTNLDNNFVGAVLMNLSKAFDFILHYFLTAKLAAYGFEEKTLYLFILGK